MSYPLHPTLAGLRACVLGTLVEGFGYKRGGELDLPLQGLIYIVLEPCLLEEQRKASQALFCWVLLYGPGKIRILTLGGFNSLLFLSYSYYSFERVAFFQLASLDSLSFFWAGCESNCLINSNIELGGSPQ